MRKHLIICLLALPLLAGCGGTQSPPDFNVVSSITPNRGVFTGGTPVVIKGHSFSRRKRVSVTIGSFPVTQVLVVDDQTITGVTGDASSLTLLRVKGAEAPLNVIVNTDGHVNYSNSAINGSFIVDHGTVPFTYTALEN